MTPDHKAMSIGVFRLFRARSDFGLNPPVTDKAEERALSIGLRIGLYPQCGNDYVQTNHLKTRKHAAMLALTEPEYFACQAAAVDYYFQERRLQRARMYSSCIEENWEYGIGFAAAELARRHNLSNEAATAFCQPRFEDRFSAVPSIEPPVRPEAILRTAKFLEKLSLLAATAMQVRESEAAMARADAERAESMDRTEASAEIDEDLLADAFA